MVCSRAVQAYGVRCEHTTQCSIVLMSDVIDRSVGGFAEVCYFNVPA